MEQLEGTVSNIRQYEEDKPTDIFLALSKIEWIGICLLFPVALFKVLNNFYGPIPAIFGLLILALLVRIFGPFHTLVLDELLSRIFPAFRSPTRSGKAPVREFRVRDGAGNEHAVLLKGELRGSSLIRGDGVILMGKFVRGSFFCKEGVNKRTGAEIIKKSNYSWIIFLCTSITLGHLIGVIYGIFNEILNEIL